MRITAAALILACSGLLFVVADAAGLRPPSWPWSEDAVADAAGLRPPWSEDAVADAAGLPPWSEDAETEFVGCCSPVIVRTSSIIQSVHGQGNVAIVADYGPRSKRGHPNDSRFTYVVI